MLQRRFDTKQFQQNACTSFLYVYLDFLLLFELHIVFKMLFACFERDYNSYNFVL